MAIMIPSRIDPDSRTNESERMVFEALEKTLPDDFYVYHGLDYLEPSRANEGEADFLVLHPTKGMLVVECKGKGVFRDEQGTWWRTHRGGKLKRLREPPSKQVLRHVKDLKQKFEGPLAKLFPVFRGKFPLVYGWALAFPMASWDAVNPPPELEKEVVFDVHALPNLGDHVQRAMDFFARKFDDPPGMTEAEFKRFRQDIVSPEFGIVSILGPMLAFEKQQMLRLTKAQDRVVRRIKANRFVRVPGGAGTGKTVLAVEVARSLAAVEKNVLLLCFNKNLADHLKTTVESWEETPGDVMATSFHKLCWSAGQSLGRPLTPPKEGGTKAVQEYWTNEAPLVLLEAIEEGKIGGWDAIIADEGQDFAASWWDILKAGLREPEKGRMVIFYDPSQAIFEHGGEVPDYPIYPLDENLRNTRAIADVLLELVDIEMESHPDCPAGEAPVIYQQQAPGKTRRQLTELLDTLLLKQKVTPRDIAILTPHSPKNSILEGAAQLGEHKIVHEPSQWAEGVLHMSISGFKGLEAEIVIMLSIDPSDERSSGNARYVGASRARHRLYVFAKGDWLGRG